MTKNCSNCRYFVKGIDGRCRRYPRQPVLEVGLFPRQYKTVWDFALAHRDDICGEWKEQDNDAWRIIP